MWVLSTSLCAVVNCFFSLHYGNIPQNIVCSVVGELLWMAMLWTFSVWLLVNVCTHFFWAFVSQWISGVLGIHIHTFRIHVWTSGSLLTPEIICRVLDVCMCIWRFHHLYEIFQKCLKNIQKKKKIQKYLTKQEKLKTNLVSIKRKIRGSQDDREGWFHVCRAICFQELPWSKGTTKVSTLMFLPSTLKIHITDMNWKEMLFLGRQKQKQNSPQIVR